MKNPGVKNLVSTMLSLSFIWIQSLIAAHATPVYIDNASALIDDIEQMYFPAGRITLSKCKAVGGQQRAYPLNTFSISFNHYTLSENNESLSISDQFTAGSEQANKSSTLCSSQTCRLKHGLTSFRISVIMDFVTFYKSNKNSDVYIMNFDLANSSYKKTLSSTHYSCPWSAMQIGFYWKPS